MPVAIREFTGAQPSATWPWATDLLQGQQPQVLDGGVSLEAVAAMQPDLIVAVSAGLTQEQYDSFERIAPVVTQPVGEQPFQTRWQGATRLIGQAIGRPAEAERLVTDLESRLGFVAAEYPPGGPAGLRRATRRAGGPRARPHDRAGGRPVVQQRAQPSRASRHGAGRARRTPGRLSGPRRAWGRIAV